ncbi:MAG: ribosome silencing factor [Anaerolineaceae bacterium]|nr:ribosome silencing factor [Anaerolineaceae bacterium]
MSVLEEKKAEHILLLDIHEIVSFTDYFIICNGTTDRMLHALAASLREFAKAEFGTAIQIEGEGRDGWLIVDMGDVVVHFFSPDQREYYNLEGLWDKGKRLLSLQ